MRSPTIFKKLFVVMLLLPLCWVIANPVVAQSQTESSTLGETIQELADELAGLRITIVDIDLILSDIVHLLYEAVISVNHARFLAAQSGSQSLIESSIQDAQASLELVDIKLVTELGAIITEVADVGTDGALQGLLTILLEPIFDEDALSSRELALVNKLLLKAKAIQNILGIMDNEREDLLLGRIGTTDNVTTCEKANDLFNCLNEALNNVDDSETTRDLLNIAYGLLRAAIRDVNRLIRKKKSIIISLGIMQKITAVMGANHSASELSFNAFFLPKRPTEAVAQTYSLVDIFTIQGKRVAQGKTEWPENLSRMESQLANGLYLAVMRVFDSKTGKLIGRHMKKMAVLH